MVPTWFQRFNISVRVESLATHRVFDVVGGYGTSLHKPYGEVAVQPVCCQVRAGHVAA